jgi:YegS/Rv2252/BmrU family lipid kinase
MEPYYRRITILINRSAGKQSADVLQQVADALRGAGLQNVDVCTADGGSFGREASAAAQRGSPVVVAAGGDGSVSAAASALVGTDAALGVLPIGTLNHFAKDVGIPLELSKAAETIAAGRTIAVDVGEVNGRSFINNASIGMYASLIAERDAMRRIGREKWVAHGLAAVRVWRRYRHHPVVLGINGTPRAARTPFVFVGNNEYQLSGLELGGRKALQGGRLHICMAPGMNRRGVAWMILAAIFADVCRFQGFESFTTNGVTLDATVPRVRTSIDGEVVVLDNPLTFRIRPRALRVVVP